MENVQVPPSLDELLNAFLRELREYALVFLSTDGTVIAWLAGAERIFGYHADEIVGKNAELLFTPEDRERGIHQLELDIARRDGSAEDDRWQLRKDGARVYVSGAVVPLHRADGEIMAFGKVMRNRTDQMVRIEGLENRIDALVKADERKNLFLGTLAHELRNPLAPLTNAVDLIHLTLPESPEVAFAVTLIRRQVEFIRRMVEDLLDVTRISTGKVELKKEQIELNEVLRRVAEFSRSQIEKRRQEFQLILPPTPIVMDADPSRLHQVFVNLMNNASKYTPEGGHIWLKATIEEDDAVVRVQDDGIGIASDMLPRIFDLFTQEDSAQLQSPGGLGIGLSLVKDFVTLHGGTVLVRSDGRNKGSEFTVRLPM